MSIFKVVSAELEESEDSFLVTIQLAKPGANKQPTAKKTAKSEESAVPLAVKDIVVPEGHKVEIKVEQKRGEKAAAIELKTEEKPKEEVEHSYFETEEYMVGS